MLHEVVVGDKFWQELSAIDERIAARVARGGCPHCGGRLHRGDYARKPRGAVIAPVAGGEARRISLCCDRRGCRTRATPPSVRFLGRRVYVGVTVVIASAILRAAKTVAAAERASGICGKTLRRWSRWWRQEYPLSAHFEESRSRLVTPVNTGELPGSLWERFAMRARSPLSALGRLLRFLAPITTASVANGARFVRDA
jgi:hypothetical protein